MSLIATLSQAPVLRVNRITRFVWGGDSLAWRPKGFVITPRSLSKAPKGWGLPNAISPEGVPYGTPGGPIKQVMINRLKYNNYPDKLVEEIVRRAGLDDVQISQLEDLDYAVNQEMLKLYSNVFEFLTREEYAKVKIRGEQQFEPYFNPLIDEAPREQWYAHRPYVIEYEDLTLKTIFDMCNGYRTEVGRNPVYPVLRGEYTGLAEVVARINKETNVMSHNSNVFPFGYQTYTERYYRHGFVDGTGGENLVILGGSPQGETEDERRAYTGYRASTVWRNSPPHYANIVKDYQPAIELANNSSTTFMQVAYTDATIVRAGSQQEPILPPELPEPISGIECTQVFTKKYDWLATPWASQEVIDIMEGNEVFGHRFYEHPLIGRHWNGDAGTVYFGTNSTFCNYGVEILTNRQFRSTKNDSLLPSAVYWRGRIMSAPYPYASNNAQIIGAAVRLSDATLIVAYMHYPSTVTEKCKLAVCEWGIEKTAYQVYEAREPRTHYVYDVPLDYEGHTEVMTFSPDATKACITFYRFYRNVGAEYITNTTTNFNTGTTDHQDFYNCELEHIEFVNGHFLSRGKESVDIDVSCFAQWNVSEDRWDNFYSLNCDTTYRAHCGYSSDNELVYLRAHVVYDLKVSALPADEDDRFRFSMFGEMIYPDGTRFTYLDASCENQYSTASGVKRIITHFDINKPENIVYTEVSGETYEYSPGHFYPKVSVSVKFRDRVLKHIEDTMPTPKPEYVGTYMTWVPHNKDFSVVGTKDIPQFGFLVYSGDAGGSLMEFKLIQQNTHGDGVGFLATRLPKSNFKAMIFPGSYILNMLYKVADSDNLGGSDNSAYVGPPFMSGTTVSSKPGLPTELVQWEHSYAHLVEFDGEYIVAGCLKMFMGVIEKMKPRDEWFFYDSSLNLKAITQVGDLSQNILP
ncbi:CAP domain-containing protein [Candidatus Dojkabacteria bacterium]|uniref:CAP domain-containing protein n=1 Tax=Candidatus Dojkabacteria bacterium TaxID=2099670 RepID=A0A5C7J3T4_9BACT|nr:MAG: CAP domain-containing protein [Candidatus Dojkabacteria bacterium]